MESEDFGMKIPSPALPGFCLEPSVYTTSCEAHRRVPGGEHEKGYILLLCMCSDDTPSGVFPKPRGHLRNWWHAADWEYGTCGSCGKCRRGRMLAHRFRRGYVSLPDELQTLHPRVAVTVCVEAELDSVIL